MGTSNQEFSLPVHSSREWTPDQLNRNFRAIEKVLQQYGRKSVRLIGASATETSTSTNGVLHRINFMPQDLSPYGAFWIFAAGKTTGTAGSSKQIQLDLYDPADNLITNIHTFSFSGANFGSWSMFGQIQSITYTQLAASIIEVKASSVALKQFSPTNIATVEAGGYLRIYGTTDDASNTVTATFTAVLHIPVTA